MSTLELNGGSVEVTTYRGDRVLLEAQDETDYVLLPMSPGDAVRLSRALVAAAAEALGVAV